MSLDRILKRLQYRAQWLDMRIKSNSDAIRMGNDRFTTDVIAAQHEELQFLLELIEQIENGGNQ